MIETTLPELNKMIEETKGGLNKRVNNFNHIIARELAEGEIKEIGKLEDKLNDLQEEQERRLTQ